MNSPDHAATTAVKEAVLQASLDLLAKGLTVGTAGNLSAKLPDGNVVCTPSSLAYETMTIDDLVVVDLDGNIIDGRHNPTSEKSLHLACMKRWPHVGAVIHCHPIYATMFAVTHQPIPAVIEEFIAYVGGDVPCSDYRMTGSADLAEEVARSLDGMNATLMANHGMLTVGRTIDKALHVAELVERTAQVMWGASTIGQIVPLPAKTKEMFAGYFKMLRDKS